MYDKFRTVPTIKHFIFDVEADNGKITEFKVMFSLTRPTGEKLADITIKGKDGKLKGYSALNISNDLFNTKDVPVACQINLSDQINRRVQIWDCDKPASIDWLKPIQAAAALTNRDLAEHLAFLSEFTHIQFLNFESSPIFVEGETNADAIVEFNQSIDDCLSYWYGKQNELEQQA